MERFVFPGSSPVTQWKRSFTITATGSPGNFTPFLCSAAGKSPRAPGVPTGLIIPDCKVFVKLLFELFYRRMLPAEAMRKHSSNPTAVGRTAEKTVHFQLPVSFQMVQQVVEQGQWNRENTMTHSAVTQVHPF